MTIKKLTTETNWYPGLNAIQKELARSTVAIGLKAFENWLIHDKTVATCLKIAFSPRSVEVLHNVKLEYLMQITQLCTKIIDNEASNIAGRNQNILRSFVAQFAKETIFCITNTYIEVNSEGNRWDPQLEAKLIDSFYKKNVMKK
ncbi:MAG: hypothetical protein QM571_04050 [Micrococcaceae bacterium]